METSEGRYGRTPCRRFDIGSPILARFIPALALKPRPLFENRDDRAGEALKILLADGKGRREIDDVADGPHENARFDKPAPQRAEIIRSEERRVGKECRL